MMRLKVCLAIALLAASVSVFAQDPAKKPQMDPKMMDAMMKAGTPGAEHKLLGGMVGTWDTKLTFWTVPGADPVTSRGTSEMKWILGGRVVEQRFKGDFMGAPFEGLGYTGYDNVKKMYWSTWMDNMSTSAMRSTGNPGADGTMTFTGLMTDPLTGEDHITEERFRVIDNDHTVFEMYGPGPDGATYKMMQIEYTRKKK
jgi:Protein of unknown function (DUF1579)